MKVLVTGGAGFIGSHVVDRLDARGDEVTVLDNLDPQVHPDEMWPNYMNHATRYIRGDVREPADCRELLESVPGGERSVLIHLAAKVGVGQSMYDVREYVDANCVGTATLLEEIERMRAASRPSRIIVASSMSVYGEGKAAGRGAPIPTPESWALYPESTYAVTKRDQEELCLVFGEAYGIPTTALRFCNTYGPRQALGNPYTGVIAIFASRLLAGKQPVIFGDGKQSRDFVFVRDVADAVMRATLPETWEATRGMALNIGTGVPSTIGEVADVLAHSLCLNLGVQHAPERAGDIRDFIADAHLAERLLGWKASTSLCDGIHEMLPWLVTQAAVEDGVDDACGLLARHGLGGYHTFSR